MTPFLTLLENHIRALRAAGKRVTPPDFSSRAWLYPFATELAYADWMISLQQVFVRGAVSLVNSFIQGLSIDGDIVQDQVVDYDWGALNARLLEYQANESAAGRPSTLASLTYFGNGIVDFNSKQWQKFVKMSLGELFRGDEPWAAEVLNTWKQTQLSLITKLEKEEIAKIGEIVQESVQKGRVVVEVMEEINASIGDMSRYRSWLIAKDQTTKLNSEFAKSRMIDAGFTRYVWNTARDERVRGKPGGKYPNARPSHWAIDGKVCSWADSTVYIEDEIEVPRTDAMPKVHPGVEILCRCFAVPEFDPFLKNLYEIKD